MGALPVIPDAAIVFQRLNGDSGRAQMGCRFCVTAPGGTSVTTIANEFAQAFTANPLGILSHDISMAETEVQLLDGTTPVQVITTPSFGEAGLHAEASLPYSVCGTITWRTNVRGRSHRGRTYLPGIPAVALTSPDGYLFNDSYRGALASVGNGMLDALAVASTPLVMQVLSLKHGAITEVSSASANPHITNQRRRVERVARH